jgi:hypothetical protein
MKNFTNEFQISSSSFETLHKVEEAICHDLNSGRYDFIQLINDSKIQFSTGLSYRMLTYYTQEGMLNAKRNSHKGKRRLSLLDLQALKYLMASSPKTTKISNPEFQELKINVLPRTDYGQQTITQFELKLLSTLTLLGIRDIKLKTSNFGVKSAFEKHDYNLSKILVESLQRLDLEIDRNQEFLTKLIYEVDRLRSMLNLKVLSEENLCEIESSQFITQKFKFLAINVLPEFLKKPIINQFHEHTYIFRNEDGMIYGMEITHLGHEESLTPEDRLKFAISLNDILKNKTSTQKQANYRGYSQVDCDIG